MKRAFKEFIKQYKGIMTFQMITIKFNDWILGVKYKDGRLKGIKRFSSPAYTNKFMIQKWCKQLEISERIDL